MLDDYVFSLLQMLAALVIVCVLAYLVLRLGGRLLAARTSSSAGINILERQQIGRGQAIVTVKVGTRIFLIAAADQHISLIAELDLDDINQDKDQTAPALMDQTHRAALKGTSATCQQEAGDQIEDRDLPD